MFNIAAVGTLLCTIVVVFLAAAQGQDPDQEALEREGKIYMDKLDKEAAEYNKKGSLAEWAYETNITSENDEANVQAQLEVSNWYKQRWEEIKKIRWQDFKDFTLRRMFKKYSVLGDDALPDDKYELLKRIVTDMTANNNDATVCSYTERTKCDMQLSPDISRIFRTSNDPEELKYYWLEYHKVAGTAVKNNYTKYVELKNEAAQLNNFKNVAEQWQAEYEVDDFEALMANLWEEVKPLYLQVHAYIRKRLRDKYGKDIVSARGPIPAHLLGSMFASYWGNLDFTTPYPDKKEVNITAALIGQNYTPHKMFELSDKFFQSLNLTAMPDLFWKNSILEKPTDREIDCFASAWDFHDGKDFRIKSCTTVTFGSLTTIFHEMGHTEYQIQFRNQPEMLRDGANPGFHEAVGDTIAISMSSPKYLRSVGLNTAEAQDDDEQSDINTLYQMALDKLIFIPFAYVLELFRYGVFKGTTKPQDYNCHYWRLRESLQGLEPPAPRTEEDFDAAAFYHISADIEYARYFIAHIIQFQFHRTLCELAGEFVADDPTKKLVTCNIYQSATAGNAFAKMLQLGSSRPWPDAMEALTGQRQMKTDGILGYFKPLQDWLTAENKRTGEFIGWEESKTHQMVFVFYKHEEKNLRLFRVQATQPQKRDFFMFYGLNRTKMFIIAGGGKLLCTIIAVFLVGTHGQDPDQEALEREGQIYMDKLDKESAVYNNKGSLATWAYVTNITNENENANVNVQLEIQNWNKQRWEEIKKIRWQNFQNFTLRRMYESRSVLGDQALPDDKFELLMRTINGMVSHYTNSRVCSYTEPTKCDVPLSPDVRAIFSTSNDSEELKHYWLEYHKVAGAPVRDNYTLYVELKNEAAQLNNFKDLAASWQSQYEVDDFEALMANLWEDVKPLYLQVHAYIRKRLRDKYGKDIVSARGPIPAHLLGHMFALYWGNLNSFTIPYPDIKEVDITAAMVAQNYTPLEMFQLSDKFYQSLNLTAMPESFWKNSILEKPTDREIDCGSDAWDFHDGKDFRIKSCTTVTFSSLQTVFHEMGHIEYYIQYRNQPDVFRTGANPGFQEAVGDTIAMSMSLPKYLRSVGLNTAEAQDDDDQTDINKLYQMALDKVIFPPYAYFLELFRYGVFKGTTKPQDYNCHYWRLRESIQGLEPPAPRTEEDFDAAAFYHVAADVEYARYYIANVIQYQFHRTLCELAGEFVADDPRKKLLNCNIYQSATAGNAFAKMLQLGASKPWPDAMEALSGQRQMKADGILGFFKPLQDWLIAENKKTGEFIGWEESKIQYCTPEQKAALPQNLKPQKSKRNLRLRRP